MKMSCPKIPSPSHISLALTTVFSEIAHTPSTFTIRDNVLDPLPLLRAIDFVVPEQNCALIARAPRVIGFILNTFGAYIVIAAGADSARSGIMVTLRFTLEVEDVIFAVIVVGGEEPVIDSEKLRVATIGAIETPDEVVLPTLDRTNRVVFTGSVDVVLADLLGVGIFQKAVPPLVATVRSFGHPGPLLSLDFVAFAIANGQRATCRGVLGRLVGNCGASHRKGKQALESGLDKHREE